MSQRFPYSHSQMEKMDFCPRAFRWGYETDVKTLKDPVFFAAGHAMEAGVDVVLEALLGPDYDADEIEQLQEKAGKAIRDAFLSETCTYSDDEKRWVPSERIDWGGKLPGDVTDPLVNLVHQFAALGAGPAGYITAVHKSQVRLLAQVPGTPGFRFIPDYVADVRPAKACPDCLQACAAKRARLEAGEIKKWQQPPCDTCFGSEQVPDLDLEPVTTVLDLKTAASHWDEIACQASTQPKRYLWGLRKADPELAKLVTHAGYLIGAKSKRGGWQLLLSQATEFDIDQAEDDFYAHHDLVEGGKRPMRPGYAGKNCSWCDYRLACHFPARAHEMLRGPGIAAPPKKA